MCSNIPASPAYGVYKIYCLRRKIMFRICSEFSVMFRICSEFSVMYRIVNEVKHIDLRRKFEIKKMTNLIRNAII
jgi:hypothetical protein